MKTPRQVKDAAIRYTVRELLKRSGVYIKKRQEVMMSHAFRKNFKTVCEESGMKSLHVEMLMGHKEALVGSLPGGLFLSSSPAMFSSGSGGLGII